MADAFGQLAQILVGLATGKRFVEDSSDESAVACVLKLIIGGLSKGGEAANNGQEDGYAAHARK